MIKLKFFSFQFFMKDSSQAENLLEEFKETGLSKSLFAVELGNEIYGFDKFNWYLNKG